MRSEIRSTALLAAALATGLAMPSVGGDVEVLPRPHSGLGDWLRQNNRRRLPKLSKPPKSQLNQRLKRATGPGSYDEWKRELAVHREWARGAVNG